MHEAVVATGLLQVGTVTALPEVILARTKECLAILQILLIDSLQHLVYAIVYLLAITLDLKPQTAIRCTQTCLDTVAAEEVVAVYLTNVCRVILHPLKVNLSHTAQFVSIILLELTQVEHKVYVLPICLITLVHLAIVARLGTTT